MEIEEQLKQLDLLLARCTQKYQEGIDKADKLLAKVREPKPEKVEETEKKEN
ncbi:MAG: hypothetical protein F6K24_02560 [Okeania sp. SIO2D1]|nr:hypothetical protein [Okeania sp. SIO2D1]